MLGSTLSWDQDTDLAPSPHAADTAPRVLTHPPCSGEFPHVVDSFNVAPSALWCQDAELDGKDPFDTLPAEREPLHQLPPFERLDRPPRFFENR